MAHYPEYDGPNRRSTRTIGDLWSAVKEEEGMNEEAQDRPMVSENVNMGAIRDPWQNPIEMLADNVRETIKFYDGFLNECGLDTHVDEVAVMFNRREEMWGWLMGAVQEQGAFIFNHATDHVITSPIESRYDVEYTFVQHNSLRWRVEAMLLVGGHSPLHHALRANRVGGAHIVHASFKCRSLFEWRKAVDVLNKEGELAQMCGSTYGRFGYWTLDESLMPKGSQSLYLKPRLNERDGR